jgi:Undecaprenyl-phosphate glucose phosphotransferase
VFRVRALLINSCLAFFDLSVTAFCFFAVLITAGPRVDPEFGSHAIVTSEHLPALGWVIVVWMGSLTYFEMYRSRRMDSPFADLTILFKTALASLLVLQGIAYVLTPLRFTPTFLFALTAGNFLALGLARYLVRRFLRELRRRGHNTKNLILVASAEMGKRIEAKLGQRAHYGYRIVRNITFTQNTLDDNEQMLRELSVALETASIADVILALPAEARYLTTRLVDECENRGANVRVVPDLWPLIQDDTQVYDLDGIPLVNLHLYPTEYFGYVVLKRILDLVVSLAVLVLLFPLYLLIALMVTLTSPGPVLFVQERVGLNGRKFRMLKFRTMSDTGGADTLHGWTKPNDPRVTPVGRWLRRSNLDELPQFLNVLKGEMSIVGPRPERPAFIERFRKEVPDYRLRHYVKSGITGWAQVNGWRGDTSIPLRIAHDLYYIRNWALGLDIKILFLTLTRTFFHRNAY